MGAKDTFAFVLEYMKVNLQGAMEYRANFLIKAFGMLLNDVAWLAFWFLVFAKFQSINGWGFNDVALLWAVGTTAFGIATFFFGNWQRIEEIVIKGELDYYLALPRSALLHLLVSRSEFSGMGDILFGVGLAAVLFIHTPATLLLFAALIPLSVVILVSFAVVVGSVALFVGGTGELSEIARGAVTLLIVYPPSIFGGFAKLLIFTVLPAGLITGIPVQLLLHFNAVSMSYMLLAAAISAAIAIVVFKLGLMRYESGNLISVRM